MGTSDEVGFESFSCVEFTLAGRAGADEFILDVVKISHRVEDGLGHDVRGGIYSSGLGIWVRVDGTNGGLERCAVGSGGRTSDLGVVTIGGVGEACAGVVLGYAGEIALRRVVFLGFGWEECARSCACCFPNASSLLLCLRCSLSSDLRLSELKQITVLDRSLLRNSITFACRVR